MSDSGQAKPLAARQREVLRLIQRYVEAFDEPPTLEFLARRLSLHRKTVRQHLEALYVKGWLRHPCPDGIRCTHEPA